MLLSKWFIGGWFSRCPRIPTEPWDGDPYPWERDVDRFLISRNQNRRFVLGYIRFGIPVDVELEEFLKKGLDSRQPLTHSPPSDVPHATGSQAQPRSMSDRDLEATQPSLSE